jgi:hypothetical protein
MILLKNIVNIVNIGTGKGMTVLEFLQMYNITNYVIFDKKKSDKDIINAVHTK